MTDNIDDEVLNRLEAEATVADAEPEELTLMVESDVEQKDEEIEELQSEIDEKESQVEELQSEVDEKEERIEEMEEKVNTMAQSYAEELAQHSDLMDADEFVERYTFEELQEKVDDLDGGAPTPAPNSGDPGAGFQSGSGGDDEEGEAEELSEKQQAAASAFRERAKQSGNDYWTDIAEDIENGGE